MRRQTHRLAVLGVAGGMILSMPAAAVAQTDRASTGSTECVVQYVDDRGEVVDTTVAREGAMYGQFRCARGQWVFGWSPFGRDDAIAAPEIQVDRSGAVGKSQGVPPPSPPVPDLARFADNASRPTCPISGVSGDDLR